MSTESATVPIWSFARRVDRRGREDSELLSVYRDHGVVPKSSRDDNFNKESDDLSNYLYVEQGDLVLNKMKTWQGSLAVSKFEGIVSPAYFVCQLSPQVEPRFIHYLLRSEPLIAEYAKRSKGVRPNQWDLPFDEFKAIEVTLPPVEEQRRIAEFLDDQVARIDKAIESKHHQIRALDELSVSKSLSILVGQETSNGAGVSTQDDWIRQLPMGWEMQPLNRLVSSDNSGAWGEDEGLLDVDTPVATTAQITAAGDFDVLAMPIRSFSATDVARFMCKTNDILVVKSSGSATSVISGKCGLVRADTPPFIFSNFLLRLHAPDSELGEWIVAFLQSHVMKERVKRMVSVTTYPNLKVNEYLRSLIPLPPRTQLAALVDELNGVRRNTRLGVDQVRTSVQLLEERKRALITAAVTGKLDVTTAQPIGLGKWVPNVGASVEAPGPAQSSGIGGIG